MVVVLEIYNKSNGQWNDCIKNFHDYYCNIFEYNNPTPNWDEFSDQLIAKLKEYRVVSGDLFKNRFLLFEDQEGLTEFMLRWS